MLFCHKSNWKNFWTKGKGQLKVIYVETVCGTFSAVHPDLSYPPHDGLVRRDGATEKCHDMKGHSKKKEIRTQSFIITEKRLC